MADMKPMAVGSRPSEKDHHAHDHDVHNSLRQLLANTFFFRAT